ncbi:MAG: hypothetical protein IIZ28_06740 [Erysipelotrichaceae bacterium]|nr:hypothetical protein [Erysipelotrichaceae bacterium]
MIKVYGSLKCPYCVVLKENLDRNNVAYDFIDILESLGRLGDLAEGKRLHGLRSGIGLECPVLFPGPQGLLVFPNKNSAAAMPRLFYSSILLYSPNE